MDNYRVISTFSDGEKWETTITADFGDEALAKYLKRKTVIENLHQKFARGVRVQIQTTRL